MGRLAVWGDRRDGFHTSETCDMVRDHAARDGFEMMCEVRWGAMLLLQISIHHELHTIGLSIRRAPA